MSILPKFAQKSESGLKCGTRNFVDPLNGQKPKKRPCYGVTESFLRFLAIKGVAKNTRTTFEARFVFLSKFGIEWHSLVQMWWRVSRWEFCENLNSAPYFGLFLQNWPTVMSPRIHKGCKFFFAVGLFGKVLTSTLRGAKKNWKKLILKAKIIYSKMQNRKNAFFLSTADLPP